VRECSNFWSRLVHRSRNFLCFVNVDNGSPLPRCFLRGKTPIVPPVSCYLLVQTTAHTGILIKPREMASTRTGPVPPPAEGLSVYFSYFLIYLFLIVPPHLSTLLLFSPHPGETPLGLRNQFQFQHYSTVLVQSSAPLLVRNVECSIQFQMSQLERQTTNSRLSPQ